MMAITKGFMWISALYPASCVFYFHIKTGKDYAMVPVFMVASCLLYTVLVYAYTIKYCVGITDLKNVSVVFAQYGGTQNEDARRCLKSISATSASSFNRSIDTHVMGNNK